MKLILLGAPGAGKGSQAVKISAKYNIPHISTGDILRKNIGAGTELGKKAKAYVEAGQLVPNELIIDLMADRIAEDDAKGGFILDGFPRSLGQAEALSEVTDIDIVLEIQSDVEVIIKRLEGRAKIEGRADDNPETIRNRLKVYEKETAPLIGYYTEKGLLKAVDGNGNIEDIFEELCKVLDDFD